MAARLAHERASVRRVAALDLMRIATESPELAAAANGALLEHLAREGEVRIAMRIVRHFGAVRWGPARGVLWALYADRGTPVEIAHAAVLAHDRLEEWEEGMGNRQ